MSKKAIDRTNQKTVSSTSKVRIVSTYGRGLFLAHKLKQLGFRVLVYDVSAFLPTISSADREGPFGVFLPSHLSDLEKQYLCGDNYYLVPQGFSLFTSQGPLELQGVLNSFFRKTRKNFQLCYSILSHFDPKPFNFSKHKKNLFYEELEEQSTLLRLSAELTNSHLEPFCLKKFRKKCLSGAKRQYEKPSSSYGLSPLFADYVLRESSKRYFEESKTLLQEEGVEWLDVFPSSGNKYEWEESSDFLVWTLSGPETRLAFPESVSFIFPGLEKPEKIWLRFPLSWASGDFETLIPSILLVMPDYKMDSNSIFSLETKKPIISLKKTPADSRTQDLWMLCPYEDRFNKSVLSKLLSTVLKRLNILFPGFSIEGTLPKMESSQEYFVLYAKQNMFLKKKVPARIFHLNPEQALKLDPYSLMQESAICLKQIQERA